MRQTNYQGTLQQPVGSGFNAARGIEKAKCLAGKLPLVIDSVFRNERTA